MAQRFLVIGTVLSPGVAEPKRSVVLYQMRQAGINTRKIASLETTIRNWAEVRQPFHWSPLFQHNSATKTSAKIPDMDWCGLLIQPYPVFVANFRKLSVLHANAWYFLTAGKGAPAKLCERPKPV